ncbi:MAG: aminotransferase class IV family protein [Dokdonella sp.]
MMRSRIEINGDVAGAEDLQQLALVNYGHFTSMQVRGGCVRGFDLHVQRLADATRELFGSELDTDATRRYIRHALEGVNEPQSLRVTVFAREFDRMRPEQSPSPDVLVSTSSARDNTRIAPLRVRSIHYQREFPHIKHVGTFALFHHQRLARLAGFDDALFTTPTGDISEGSIWNVGFWDGDRVVFPTVPALRGVTLQLLEIGLRRQGVAYAHRNVNLSDLASLQAAFTMNSGALGQPIASIDACEFNGDPQLATLLQIAYESNPPQLV